MSNRIGQQFRKSVGIVVKASKYIGNGMLLVMMILGVVDVMGRYVFNMPIIGAQEVERILLAGVVFFGWSYTQSTRGQVVVNLVRNRFSPRVQAMAGIIDSIVGLVLFGLIAWRVALIAILYWKSNRLFDVIMWPRAPFQLFVSAGALFLCLVLIVQMLESLSQMKGGKS